MKQTEIPISAMEPFNIGRSTFRLFFDFGVMLSCFSSSPNKRVLDFGAGTGWISEFLVRLGYEVCAIDIDAGMPTSIRARALADRRLNPMNITMVTGSGMDLPFPDGFFSHLCCFDTLHHMNDYPKTFREMSRVLAPGGRAVFIEPGARHSRSKETIEFIETYKKDDPTWIERDVVLDEIAQISKESGFSDVIVLPTLLPGLRSYTASQWTEFRQGDPSLANDYLDLLKDFNYNDHLSFYCEKPSVAASEVEKPLTVGALQDRILRLSGKKIALDLTPLLPGGENGGAKPMTLELISALARLLRNTSFILLTAEASHPELDWLEQEYPNVRRICVLQNITQPPPSVTAPQRDSSWRNKAFETLRSLAERVLPQGLTGRIRALPVFNPSWRNQAFEQLEVSAKRILPSKVRKLLGRWVKVPYSASTSTSLLGQLGVNLLFCPFTAPFYADPLIPTISVIYDLQYRAYPQFFAPEELIQREDNFGMAYQRASYLVTISEFVRQTVIEAAHLSPERVIAVPIGLLRTPKQLDNEMVRNELLAKYHLRRGEYLLYPANFWHHKNHAMLLTAFNLYRRANPDSTLKLLCTGAPGPRAEAFCEAIRRMGLTDWIIYPGYVSPNEYDFLLRSAFAVIFPSLYEGFGIPVLEAMSAGVPVLCSNVTSLPEVGGDAVLYFDPRRPDQIVSALIRLSEEPALRETLITRGLQRTQLFEGVDRMAIEYAEVFSKAISHANGNLSTGH